MLGAVTRNITRKLAGRPELAQLFALPLSLARRIRDQRQRKRGRTVYSLHAPEVECIGDGKAHKPYEFGVKVSIATTLERNWAGGRFADRSLLGTLFVTLAAQAAVLLVFWIGASSGAVASAAVLLMAPFGFATVSPIQKLVMDCARLAIRGKDHYSRSVGS